MRFLNKDFSENAAPERECSCPELFDSELMRVLAIGLLAVVATASIVALACHTIKRLGGKEDFTCD